MPRWNWKGIVKVGYTGGVTASASAAFGAATTLQLVLALVILVVIVANRVQIWRADRRL